jgi:hypothetical protein
MPCLLPADLLYDSKLNVLYIPYNLWFVLYIPVSNVAPCSGSESDLLPWNILEVHQTPTRNTYTYEVHLRGTVQLHLRGTTTPTGYRYRFTFGLQLHLRGIASLTMNSFICARTATATRDSYPCLRGTGMLPATATRDSYPCRAYEVLVCYTYEVRLHLRGMVTHVRYNSYTYGVWLHL